MKYLADRLKGRHHVLFTPPSQRHGNAPFEKLKADTARMKELFPRVVEFAPELVLSRASVVAARLSFGLQIKHVSFCERAERSLRMVSPLVQKMLVPSLLPARIFSGYGIHNSDIIRYRGIPDAFTPRQETSDAKGAVLLETSPAMESIHGGLSSKFPKVATIRDGTASEYGGDVPADAALFIGYSPLVIRAALVGVPTISYSPRLDAMQRYLIRHNLLVHRTKPNDIMDLACKMAGSSKTEEAGRVVSGMEDPYDILLRIVSV